MNIIREQQQQPTMVPVGLGLNGGSGNGGDPSMSSNMSNLRQAHLTKFAFLLSSARGEGSDEPVVGMHHDVEMAECFSNRHLCDQGMSNMRVAPPSISSSSLSMQNKNGTKQTVAGSSKQTLLDMAALNMSTPFYTTPDTVSSTAKTVLKNSVSTMEELMDSRLRSTVSQLVRRAGGINHSPLLFRLLSPSRQPIQVATVITRFILPDSEDDENAGVQRQSILITDETLSIPLQFKAVLDIKVFGEVTTVELIAPVTMSGKFDSRDGLLTAVDISFDCSSLLQSMITHARMIIKKAVAKAATLSVQITDWLENKKKPAQSTLSLQSLLGSGMSLNSMANGDEATVGSLLSSFSSQANAGSLAKQKSFSKGILRENSKSMLRQAFHKNNAVENRNRHGGHSFNNANATFDFGTGKILDADSGDGAFGRTASTVRFQEPLKPQHQHHVQEEEEAQPQNKGNIHAGLFSWLQDDSMFLTDEKIEEQNAADAERERKRREAPMPLRFFTAADDMGGGECSLELVSKSIFGGDQGNSDDQDCHRDKRRRVWP